MTRTRRHRIALFLSLLMTAFLFCQGMAQAAVLATAMPVQHQPMKMDMGCHEAQPATMAKASAECPSGCQHLDKATDSALSLLTLDYLIPMVAFFLPALGDEVGARQLAALSPIPPDPDPPPAIRYHRFRE